MKKILKNWKTSLAGLGTIILGVSKIVSGDTVNGVTVILTGLGLIHANDAQ